MNRVTTNTRVTTTATIELDECQLRALDALVGYGTDSFLEVFYEKMGRYYLEPHEQGLRDLFENIKTVCGPALSDCDAVRELLKEAKRNPALGS